MCLDNSKHKEENILYASENGISQNFIIICLKDTWRQTRESIWMSRKIHPHGCYIAGHLGFKQRAARPRSGSQKLVFAREKSPFWPLFADILPWFAMFPCLICDVAVFCSRSHSMWAISPPASCVKHVFIFHCKKRAEANFHMFELRQNVNNWDTSWVFSRIYCITLFTR